MNDAVEVKSIKLPDNVPRIFNVSQNGELCAKDIIAYVRGDVEKDPWIPVVLETLGKPIAIDELEESLIFWKGYNDKKAYASVRSVGQHMNVVVKLSELNPDDDDCGLNIILANFSKTYQILNFDALIVGYDDSKDGGKNVNLLMKLREYVKSSERDDVIFPSFIVRKNKLLENGLDISKYAEDIANMRHRNALDAKYLDALLGEIADRITPQTVIQDLKEQRTQDVKLLSTYLALEYNLPPVYVASFISEYIRFEFLYPFKQLSLFERLQFLKNIPAVVGYIGKNQEFDCLAQVMGKIYPAPHYVFDLKEHRLVEDIDQFQFTNSALKLFDFRRQFLGNKSPVNGQATDMASIKSDDKKIDHNFVDMFTELSSLVQIEPVYLSVKNSVIAQLNGDLYILYCPEECALHLRLVSQYFGSYELDLLEEEFNHLIDAQIEKALLMRSRSASAREGTTQLAITWRAIDNRLALKPAIPYKDSLYMKLLPMHQNGLSYYDVNLRCAQNVLPIITSLDSKYRDVSPLFNEISLEALRDDPVSRYAINCFGTVAEQTPQNPVIPITYKAFKQRGLL